MKDNTEFKSGFVTIVGPPNSGKSTLLNSMFDKKISIVSSRPQTTRFQIKAVYNNENTQIVFIDTPGLHHTKKIIGRYLIKEISSSFFEIDIILNIIDCTKLKNKLQIVEYLENQKDYLEKYNLNNKPIILLLNKTDKINQEDLITIISTIDKDENLKNFYSDIVPLSALKKYNFENIIKVIRNYLTDNIKYYDEKSQKLYSDKVYFSELTRETIFKIVKEEVPYSILCSTERILKRKNGNHYVQIIIYVERPTQRQILLGKKGKMIKEIGELTRVKIEEYLKSKVYLDLNVAVLKDWQSDEKVLKDIREYNEL